MKQEKKFIYSALSLLCMLTLTLSAYPQSETGISNKQKNSTAVSKTALPADDKTKSASNDTQKKDSPVKKDSASAVNDKTTGKDSKKTDASNSAKGTGTKKEDKKAETWDDTKKGEKISSTLDYGMQKDRKTAIIMINDIKDEQVKNRLVQKLVFIVENDSDIEVKKAAVTEIGDLKADSAVPALIKALDDPSEEIKIAACYALSRMKAESAKPKLVELFRKQDLKLDSNLTDAVITTLYDIKAPDILDTAITAGKDSSTSKMIREKLIMYIGYTGSAAQKDFLLEIFKNDDEDIALRSLAVKSISVLKLKETAGDIKNLLKEIDSYSFNKKKKYYDLYIQSVATLVAMGDTDSVELLMGSLRSDNAAVRLKAVNLIKEFSDQRTIDILKYKMDNDPSGKVRKAARKALQDKGIVEKGKEDEDSKNDNIKEEKDE